MNSDLQMAALLSTVILDKEGGLPDERALRLCFRGCSRSRPRVVLRVLGRLPTLPCVILHRTAAPGDRRADIAV